MFGKNKSISLGFRVSGIGVSAGYETPKTGDDPEGAGCQGGEIIRVGAGNPGDWSRELEGVSL